MAIKILIVGITGFLISFGVLFVSLLLPIVNGPRTSWKEALAGIVPGALCSFLFLIVSMVGLILLLTSQAPAPRRRSSEEFDESDAPADDASPVAAGTTVHLVLSLVMATGLGLASLVMLFFGVVGTFDGWSQLQRVRPGPYEDIFRGSTADYFNGSVTLTVAGLCCLAAALILALRRRAAPLGSRPWYLYLVALLPLGIGIRAWPLGWSWGREAAVGMVLTGVCLVLALLKNWSVSSRLSVCLTLAALGYACWMVGWLTATSPYFRGPRPFPSPPRPKVSVPEKGTGNLRKGRLLPFLRGPEANEMKLK